MDELISNYNELILKLSKSNNTDAIQRLKLINIDINNINDTIIDFIDDLDRTNFNLTDQENQRIFANECLERSINNIKPLILLSVLYETGSFDK
jgi:hypothetical protein